MHQSELKRILSGKGISEEFVRALSAYKKEPEWMLEYRLKAYNHYKERKVPTWGADLSDLKDEDLSFFTLPESVKENSWEDLPSEMREVYDKLKLPEAEKNFLAGVETQFDSNVVFGRMKEKWKSQGVIFTDTDTAVQKYPKLLKKWFGKVIPYSDNKYAALNAALWSGGSFVYLPKGVKLSSPLQAYFYIQSKRLGQFERTLIVAEEGAEVSYIEGCSAPNYSGNTLHSGVIELVALKGAKIRYTTIQNWSKNVYNLVTQRGLALESATIEWVDCNIGSKVTMKYPSVILAGKKAHGEVLSLAIAEENMHIDSGAKMIHKAPDTSSIITTKSISKGNGRSSYRGKVEIAKGAKNCKSKVLCDALLIDEESKTDTYPYNISNENSSYIEHEASVSKLAESKLHYLKARGINEDAARSLIVSGFLEPVTKELPLEFAVELNLLIDMSMEGSVG